MDDGTPIEPGQVEIDGHRTWYGVADPGGSSRAPLLLVHCGPGIPHDYLLPLVALADERPVVFYDQFGCGRSDRAEDPDSYTIDLFVEELARVRERLGLDRVHLLAHSYGGPLALEYLLRSPAEGVLSLTLSNSFASVPGLADGWEQRLAELAPDQAKTLRDGATGSPDYGAALGAFVERFVVPGPPPDLLVAAQSSMGEEVYARMHGSSWFAPDGRWAGWDATSRLSGLSLPVLAISGVRDQCVPALSRAVAEGVPNGRLEVLDTAHLPMFERPEEYLALVREFLSQVEAGQRS